ncbi:NrtA/SsuA/CpmA family ABC transporter substrate-binding protein [Cellulomonas sp. CW35]|uniref:NrtA/SsuA/CpmA family ABC transporter substrate-binding protein n=1 Tax=unclassified Cellulomonas TaxID=2620175 RepID=UPI000B8DA962|nr:NrtA/SsuA/CpmA family ABC transporter substrate-binding protein [Cellulomonas sp. PSBB021]ASR55558.1 hypothetical protein CBP52_11170 [Cellulomonas sp. PSBB021]
MTRARLTRSPLTRVRPRALAALALAAALAGCAATADGTTTTAPPDVPVRVGVLTTQNLLTLAAGDRTLDEAVASVGARAETTEPFAAFAPAAEAMAAGRVDVTSGSTTAVVAALAGDPDLVVVAVERTDGDTQGIVATPASGIADVGDLAGHSVAVNQGGTGEYLLRLALRRAGLTPDDVETVYLAPPDAAAAFAAGKVDAWATWDQYLVGAQVDGARTVALARDLGSDNASVHVARRDFVDAHPDVVRAVVDALAAEADALAADPAPLADAYRDAGASDAVVAGLTALATPRLAYADEDLAAELARVAELYVEEGLLAEPVDVSRAWHDVRG